MFSGRLRRQVVGLVKMVLLCTSSGQFAFDVQRICPSIGYSGVKPEVRATRDSHPSRAIPILPRLSRTVIAVTGETILKKEAFETSVLILPILIARFQVI